MRTFAILFSSLLIFGQLAAMDNKNPNYRGNSFSRKAKKKVNYSDGQPENKRRDDDYRSDPKNDAGDTRKRKKKAYSTIEKESRNSPKPASFMDTNDPDLYYTKNCFEEFPGVRNIEKEFQKIDYSGTGDPTFKTFLDHIPDEGLENINFDRLIKPLNRSYSSIEKNHLNTEMGRLHSTLELRDMINFDKKRFERLDLPISIKQDLVNYFGPVLIETAPFEIYNASYFGKAGELSCRIIRGKNLYKITSAYIFHEGDRESVLATFNLKILQNDHSVIEAIFFIPEHIESGIYKIKFEDGKTNFSIERNIFIKSPNDEPDTILVETSLEEFHLSIGEDFECHNKPHELLFAPDLTKVEFKDYREANMRDSNGATALVHAIMQGNIELFKFLLESEVDTNVATFAFEYPIMFAAERGDIEMMQLLIEYGAFINDINTNKENSLFYAYKNKRLDAVKYLIETGANEDQLDKDRKNYKGEEVSRKPKMRL